MRRAERRSETVIILAAMVALALMLGVAIRGNRAITGHTAAEQLYEALVETADWE